MMISGINMLRSIMKHMINLMLGGVIVRLYVAPSAAVLRFNKMMSLVKRVAFIKWAHKLFLAQVYF